MRASGVMQEIRALLNEDKSSGELIRMGFAPGTVYKVQRRWRREHAENGHEPSPTPIAQPAPSYTADGQTDQDEPPRNRSANMGELIDDIREVVNPLKATLFVLEQRIDVLETELQDATARADRERDARSDLEDAMGHLSQTVTSMAVMVAQGTIKPAHPIRWAFRYGRAWDLVRTALRRHDPAAATALLGK